jgi:glycosidase
MNDFHWGGFPGNGGGQGELVFSDDFFPPLKSKFFFNRCGPNSYAEMSGEGPPAVYGDFTAGMLDFDTRNYDFQEIFTNLHKYWIAYADIDGFRLDAAKHVTEDFLAYFSTNIRDYANSLGKDNFFIVGEVAGSSEWQAQRLGNMYMNPLNPNQHGNIPLGAVNRVWTLKDTYLNHPRSKFPGLNSVYDFIESGKSREVLLSQKPASWIAGYIGDDNYNRIAGQVSDSEVFWTLIEIHDWPRFLQQNPTDGGRAYAALGHLLTMQGMPIIYYGLEQGFNGNCDQNKIKVGNSLQTILQDCSSWSDSRKRQDMFMSGPYKLGSAIPEIQDLAFIGSPDNSSFSDWKSDPMLKTDHYLYQVTKKLLKIRKSCDPLMHGRTYFRESGGNIDDIIVFSRISATTEIVVVINPKGIAITYPKVLVDSALNSNSNGQKYINLLNPSQVGYIGYENGNTYLYFTSGFIYRSVSIFASEKSTGLYLPELGINLCK